MKKPKPPKQPSKPKQPTEPNKYLPAEHESINIYDGSSLADILSAVKNVDPAKVVFSSTCGYYDDYTYEFGWTAEPKPNPKYEQQMILYNKKMLDYNQEMIEYRKQMEIFQSTFKEYQSLQKQYLKWFHANELQKLE